MLKTSYFDVVFIYVHIQQRSLGQKYVPQQFRRNRVVAPDNQVAEAANHFSYMLNVMH